VTSVQIMAVPGIGEVQPGADLAGMIAAAAPWLRDRDILVVTSKIISKAEGQLVELPGDGPARDAAREEILTAETARTVARRGQTHIVATHHGFVMASAGIDSSNVDPSRVVLLPKDPDASARALRSAFRERFGVDVAVVVSDTMGRPWRNGLTDVALGAAGIEPIRDYRGQVDPYGNELHITQMAVIDELAAAAELVKGKFDGIPVAVIRGVLAGGPDPRQAGPDGPGAAALIRGADNDLFSLGTAEARALGLRDAVSLADAPAFADTPVDRGVAHRALASVNAAPSTRLHLIAADQSLPHHTVQAIRCELSQEPIAGDEPASLIALGVDVHRLRCALAAEGLATVWLPEPSGGGTLAIGAPG
jgi:coenzyme F420-0:L-glutamate ligase / coenzyme F420-1:gamma-L-glutamate ligase